MKVFLVVSKEYDQNTYCCFDPAASEGVVIDPGANHEGVVSFLNAEKLHIAAVLLTHGHYDHVMSARRIADFTKAGIYAHRSEADLLADPILNLSVTLGGEKAALHIDKPLIEGDEIHFGDSALTVIHTPGHTPGGVSFYSEKDKVIFTGDTLFWESIGRTDLPLGDGVTLTKSIFNRLLVLPGDTTVYPGHGRPTDIRHEAMIHRRIP